MHTWVWGIFHFQPFLIIYHLEKIKYKINSSY